MKVPIYGGYLISFVGHRSLLLQIVTSLPRKELLVQCPHLALPALPKFNKGKPFVLME